MTIRTLSIALLVTGTALLASYLPMPDSERFARAAEAYSADATAGFHALAYEGGLRWDALARTVDRVPSLSVPALPMPSLDGLQVDPLLPAAGAAMAALGLIGLLGFRRLRTGTPRRARSQATRKIQRARTMARQGGVPLDVARRNTLSRDAVDLMSRIQGPDGISGRGRSFRPGGLRRAHA